MCKASTSIQILTRPRQRHNFTPKRIVESSEKITEHLESGLAKAITKLPLECLMIPPHPHLSPLTEPSIFN